MANLPPRPGRSTLLRKVNAFNRMFPVGTEVIVRSGDGDEFQTKIAAPAQTVAGKLAIGWFAGLDGYFPIHNDTIIRLAG